MCFFFYLPAIIFVFFFLRFHQQAAAGVRVECWRWNRFRHHPGGSFLIWFVSPPTPTPSIPSLLRQGWLSSAKKKGGGGYRISSTFYLKRIKEKKKKKETGGRGGVRKWRKWSRSNCVPQSHKSCLPTDRRAIKIKRDENSTTRSARKKKRRKKEKLSIWSSAATNLLHPLDGRRKSTPFRLWNLSPPPSFIFALFSQTKENEEMVNSPLWKMIVKRKEEKKSGGMAQELNNSRLFTINPFRRRHKKTISLTIPAENAQGDFFYSPPLLPIFFFLSYILFRLKKIFKKMFDLLSSCIILLNSSLPWKKKQEKNDELTADLLRPVSLAYNRNKPAEMFMHGQCDTP